MSQDLRTIYQRWVDGLNRHDLSIVAELHSPDFVDHSGTGLSGQAYIEMMQQGFMRTWQNLPDYRLEVLNVVVEGDTLAFYQTLNGTHSGVMMGVPATGKTVRILEAGMVRIVKGQFVERWLLLDRFGLMQQLGGTYPFPT